MKPLEDQDLAYERAVLEARRDPSMRALVEQAFLHEDPGAALTAFAASEHAARAKRLLRAAGVRPGARVLELGGGRGLMSAILSREGFDVALCEPNPSDVCGAGAAREVQATTGLAFQVTEGGIGSLPRTPTFDAVVCRPTSRGSPGTGPPGCSRAIGTRRMVRSGRRANDSPVKPRAACDRVASVRALRRPRARFHPRLLLPRAPGGRFRSRACPLPRGIRRLPLGDPPGGTGGPHETSLLRVSAPRSATAPAGHGTHLRRALTAPTVTDERRVASGFSWLALGYLGRTLAYLSLTTILARSLDPGAFGRLSVFLAVGAGIAALAGSWPFLSVPLLVGRGGTWPPRSHPRS